MACASPLRILALRPSQAYQVVMQWLELKFTFATPPPQACAEFYLRIAPATRVFTLRLSRTYPTRCFMHPHIAHIMAPAHCLYHKHLDTAPRCNLLTHLYQSHQCTCKLPFSKTPSHPASLLLTFALKSPSHLFTLPHYNFFSRGVVSRMSRLKKMRLTSTYPRTALTESTSIELTPHGLRVKIPRKNFPGLQSVRLTTASLRVALITSLSSRLAMARAKIYHRIASTTGLC